MQEQPVFKCWSETLWLKKKIKDQGTTGTNAQNTPLQEQQQIWQRLVKHSSSEWECIFVNSASLSRSISTLTTLSGKRQQTFLLHITELLLRKHRLLKCGACTKCKHGPLLPEREKDVLVSSVMQPFSGGTHQHSPSPNSQPDPAHQTCAKSSVNWSGTICQLPILRPDSLHDSSLLF